jgi:hypothetical protein
MSFINRKTGETKIPPKPSPPKTFDITVRGDDGQVAERIWGRLKQFREAPDLVGVPVSFQALRFTLPDDLDDDAMFTGTFGSSTYGTLETRVFADGRSSMVALPSPHFDPSNLPLRELAQIRGALWVEDYPMPFAPRPLSPDNCLDYDAGARSIGWSHNGLSWTEADFLKMARTYRSRGYTHADCGPFHPWNAAGSGYYNEYPATPQWTPDRLADHLQVRYWDQGIAPIVFTKPDNWDWRQLDELTEFYSYPRLNRLIKIVVPGGWEPSRDTHSDEYRRWLEWGARVFPNALRCLHMFGDFDAPGNNDDFTPGQPLYIGHGAAWGKVAPYIHVYLSQTNGYSMSGDGTPSEHYIHEFTKLYSREERSSLVRRFRDGYDGWPRGSAWGPDQPLEVCAFEFASYGRYRKNFPVAPARMLGDLAISVGAIGSGDGLSLPRATPCPWQP